ncbi:MAG: hypothetical protein IPP48_05415 [Chitinophagaceae bacterium]|nr:hypothetical protein [Chitinophagaceae bacterium]
MKFSTQTTPKSRITNAEATVVQTMHIAVSDKRAVFVCRALLLLFGDFNSDFSESKKEKL